jgi:ATP-dependent DNA helicase RecG
MITLATLGKWLNAPAETERLEFKEAKQSYEKEKLFKYCVALANEGGGHLVFGVTDKPPRRVVGSQAFPSQTSLNEIKARIVEKLRFRVEVIELQHPNGRVLVFEICRNTISLRWHLPDESGRGASPDDPRCAQTHFR